MKRFINQINVSITTNRTCTLRCDHCYIEKHLFNDRTQMKKEVFKKIFDKIERLYEIDNNLHEVEWEMIGGETTMMPYEWWEEMLPYALERISAINKKLKVPGALNFLSNLIYRDKRYTELFNKYGHLDEFCIYTSWEPDTGRFGKNNKKEKEFFDTLSKINCKNKILDIILTKEICELGPKYILEKFLPYGITDFSFKQLSPYGSGKSFFHPNMAGFKEMSDFLIGFSKIKPEHITFTPEEEMISSLLKGTSFQCNGNFKYDLVIEPNGVCTFNASQTASEAAVGFQEILIDDGLWEYKILFENTIEENNKLVLKHPECNRCDYLKYCNGGWYHYKIADIKDIHIYKNGECSGFRNMWMYEENKLKSKFDEIKSEYKNQFKKRLKKNNMNMGMYYLESNISKDYNQYFDFLSKNKHIGIIIDQEELFGKKIIERIWFYSGLNINFKINNDILLKDHNVIDILNIFLYNSSNNIDITLNQINMIYDKNKDFKYLFDNHIRSYKGISNLNTSEDFNISRSYDSGSRHIEVYWYIHDNREEPWVKSLLNNSNIMIYRESELSDMYSIGKSLGILS